MRNLSTFVAAAALVMVLVACNGDQPSKEVTPNATDVRPTAIATPEAIDRPPTAEATGAPSPNPTEEPDQEPVSTLRSTKERAAPTAADADLAALVRGNTAFAFDLYEALREDGNNLFYSPYSISLALAMTYAGARGDTETQMAGTLHFDLPQDNLHSTFNALDVELASRGRDDQTSDTEGFKLRIANAVWGQHDYEFQEMFLDLLAENYGAGVRPANFREDPEKSRLTINDWIAEQTEDRIMDLIPKGVIDSLTRMVLTNAIYFNAAWAFTFEEQDTSEAPFYLLDGNEILVPMMRQTARFDYARGDGYQVVDLPYVGHELSMTILLPDEGHFGEFEDSLDATLVERVLGDVQRKEVSLVMPKFEFESQFPLARTLEEMGMSNAFDKLTADFSGMDGNSCAAGDVPCLFVKAVIHKAFVSVDEQGTEAAASTAVVVVAESARPEPIRVAIDRPFIFLIRDSDTGAILFLGRVLDPRG